MNLALPSFPITKAASAVPLSIEVWQKDRGNWVPLCCDLTPAAQGTALSQSRYLLPLEKTAPSTNAWTENNTSTAGHLNRHCSLSVDLSEFSTCEDLGHFGEAHSMSSSWVSAKEVEYLYGTATATPAETGAWATMYSWMENCWSSQQYYQRTHTALCISLSPLPFQEQVSRDINSISVSILLFQKSQPQKDALKSFTSWLP